jgi:alkanesulfonate monooxygenase SsuD/methylene tetrahydromethanopterin reductase-like flavin-dependent oxidoreductase (luciferase family)
VDSTNSDGDGHQPYQTWPIVTPLPRRRPWKLARESVTLDHLSQGRLILGVGLGSDSFYKEYSTYGESPDDKLHGAMLDEGLDVLMQLWSGETVSYIGQQLISYI